MLTKEGSVHNFLNFYAQVFFQDDALIKLRAQGNSVPLKRMLLYILPWYHYASRFINSRRMRKCEKSFHYFEIAALCGDGKKMHFTLQGGAYNCKG